MLLFVNELNFNYKYGLKLDNKCRFDYKLPTSVIRDVCTMATYKPNAEDWHYIFENN